MMNSYLVGFHALEKRYWVSFLVVSVTVLVGIVIRKKTQKTEEVIIVKYKDEQLKFVFRQPRLAKVSYSSLLQRVCRAFSVAPEKVYLESEGKQLQDASLAQQKVGDGSVLHLKPVPLSPALQQIEVYRTDLEKDIVPLVQQYCSSPPSDALAIEDAHVRLTETLLGRMIRLDAIDVQDDPDARMKRKEAVRWTQSFLQKLDVAKSDSLKELK
ncbi:BAG family molecular chaperone regulator Bag102 [Schizosaccharomyces cryophilus OY26]|uniref:BAG family molecular chaperone regulator Bag102 n=1 Tax=Schizosaccharomyces cryophilus (strain OY26 / ATCC MYA-4695 / CBS 11777 / NBRC 106824 / NRRL Y48691) TaxID=653667 RepID=S9WXQ8_SCHCR|nr:BAG family molecular chaperone regulator Bag102 [Schizosaccharomyces cryophilus OY26]EPY49487.1 BAG family molecular chaperone regulator Bag102 [Schizosaccharomyces cryophilus OY26]